MAAPLLSRARTSLRVRLFLATVILLAAALAVAAIAFERVAKSVVVDAVRSHLTARATEVHEAVARFQRERVLTVRNWAEAEAMQLTLDSGDPKFAEDYLRRTIQDQGGSVTAAALLDVDGSIVAAVREGAAGEQRGVGLAELRGGTVEPGLVKEARDKGEVAISLEPLSHLVRSSTEGDALFLVAPVKDFAEDLCGFVVAAIAPAAFSRLLAEVNGEHSTYQPVLADRDRRLLVSLPGVDREDLPALFAGGATPGVLEELERASGETVLAIRTAPTEERPGWASLMLVSESKALGRLTWMRALLAGMSLLVLAAAAAASVGALRQASKPLTDVAASLSRVAGGDLSTRLRAEYTDELGHLVQSFNTMVVEVEKSRDELQRTEAIRREVQIAHQIQTAILPVSPAVKGYEVAARMKPADDVGGDLYDILAFEDTFWTIVGDVSGHGINSGLVMMMAQAAAYGAIADDPRCSPKDVVSAVNRVIHENVRNRMKRDDYLTLMVARHLGQGKFVAAGAHQPIFITRGGGWVEVVESLGPWVGIAAEPPGIEEYEFQVAPGEAVCLITDGVLEAADAKGDLFGEERLQALLGAVGNATAPEVLKVIFNAVEVFSPTQSDDMTAVVLRRTA